MVTKRMQVAGALVVAALAGVMPGAASGRAAPGPGATAPPAMVEAASAATAPPGVRRIRSDEISSVAPDQPTSVLPAATATLVAPATDPVTPLAPLLRDAAARFGEHGAAWTIAAAGDDALRHVHTLADLDGDGANDVVAIADDNGRLSLEARRGATGDLIFTRPVPGSGAAFAAVVPTATSTGPGLLAVEMHQTGTTVGEIVTHVTVIGGDGAEVRRVTRTGRFWFAGMGYAYDGVLIPRDVFEGRPGLELDVVAFRIDSTSPVVVTDDALSYSLAVVDAATASVHTGPGDGCGCQMPFAGIDADGDGLDEMFVDRYNAAGEYVGLDAVEPVGFTDLWRASAPGFAWVNRVDDVTGDGIDDFVYWGHGPTRLMSGATGAPVWSREGDGGGIGYPARQGRRAGSTPGSSFALLGFTRVEWDEAAAATTITFLTLDGQTGAAVGTWSATFPEPTPPEGGRAYVAFDVTDDLGDVDADGFPEVAIRVTEIIDRYDPATDTWSTERRLLSRGVRHGVTYLRLWGGFAGPLHDTVDGGDGVDVVSVAWLPQAPAGERQRVTVRDGRTGATLWTRKFPGGPDLSATFAGLAGDLTGDGRAELAGQVAETVWACDGNGACGHRFRSDLLVIDPTGATLWTD